jgi:signal transduction histidine kinase
MQRRITLVLGLVFLFLIAIDLLHILWLYQNYAEEKEAYAQELSGSIGQAAFDYQRLTIRRQGNRTATFYIVSSKDSVSYRLTGSDAKQQLLFTADSLAIDSIEGGLGHSQLVQMQTRKTFDLAVFDSLFKSALHDKGIQAPYILDTFSNPAQTQKRPPGKNSKLIPTKATYPTRHKDYPVTTSSMLVNTYGDLFVYASFKPYPQAIFRKLFWPLLGSLALFIIVNGALVYVIRTIQQQKKLHEIKNDFINNMTHELRTPITIATSAIDAILNHHGLQDTEKARYYLETSKGELLHLDHLVEKILNIAIEDKNDLVLHPEKVDLKTMFSTLTDNHTLTAGKEVHFDLTIEAGMELTADKMHLSNAFNNIIDNAIKYSGNPVRVAIHCATATGKAVITIEDDGNGIAPTYLAEIFQPFFRVPHGDLHTIRGFGLGLSYVKKVIEKHGGATEVKSTLHEGSTFIISLPFN